MYTIQLAFKKIISLNIYLCQNDIDKINLDVIFVAMTSMFLLLNWVARFMLSYTIL